MSTSAAIAKQFREVYLDGTWVVGTNLKEQLSDITWKQATTKIDTINTIAALVFHLGYYVEGVMKVLEGGTLDIRDKYSFDLPPLESEEDWSTLAKKVISDADKFAQLIDVIPDTQLKEPFVDEKYGSYERNLHVIIEHGYYHLGQIVLIKKMLLYRNGL